MPFTGDYHTHTKYSHGKGTIEGNALKAISLGFKEVGITDHGFKHGAYHISRYDWPRMKEEAAAMKTKYPMIKIYLGLETNLIHTNGTIDIDKEDMDDLDILICGYHKYVKSEAFKEYFRFWLPNFALDLFGKSTVKQTVRNTDAYVNAICKNDIDIISHPCRGLQADVGEVAKAAAHYGTYLELNGKNVDMSREQIDSALNNGAKFIVSSDAHISEKVGNFTKPLEIINSFGIPHESVVNMDKLPQFRSVAAKKARKESAAGVRQ